MITLIIGLLAGAWLGWRYENVINDFIEHFKTIYHGKEK